MFSPKPECLHREQSWLSLRWLYWRRTANAGKQSVRLGEETSKDKKSWGPTITVSTCSHCHCFLLLGPFKRRESWIAFGSMRSASLSYSLLSSIIMCLLPMSQKGRGGSLLQLPHCLPLSCTCQSSGHQSPCPREDRGRRQGTCCQPPSCLAQPSWQLRLIASPCLFKSHPSTSFFHPCQVPVPHLHPQPPLPLGLAGFPRTNVLFLALMDILALQPLLNTRLNTMPILIWGVIVCLSQRWSVDGYSSYPLLMGLSGLLAFGSSVRKGQKRTGESLHCGARMATEVGAEVPVTTGGKTKSLQVIFHRRWKLRYLEGQTDKINVDN